MNATKPLLDWQDYLKTGIDIIDQQHRGLVDLVNDTAVKLGVDEVLSVEEMRTLLGFLTSYAATHFTTEEALMALSGVSEEHVLHHRQSHARFLEQVNAMIDELGRGELGTLPLMEFLGDWLTYHMLGEDQKLSQLLRKETPVVPDEAPSRSPPAREAVNRSLAGLYAFTAARNQQLQASEQAERHRVNQMAERVAAQSAELAASEEGFRALFQNGSLPVVIMRLEDNLMPGAIVDVNPAACRLLGYAASELIGRGPGELVAPAELARFPLLISELLVTGKFECEMVYVTKAGQQLTTQVSMAQFVIQGQPVAMSIIQDVSLLRAAELADEGVRQQASRFAEIRSGFLSGARGPDMAGREIRTGLALTGSSGVAGFLAKHPLFKGLAADDLRQLAAAAEVRCLGKGNIVFAKGDPAAGLFLVVRGNVLLGVSSPQGGRKVLGIFAAGQSFGEAELVMANCYPYFAEAIDEAEVLVVGAAAVLGVLDSDKGFARRMMSCLGARQHELVHDVESFTLRTGAERVIGYLLQHARIESGGRLVARLPATKQLIASLLNIKPETLSRIFRDLSDTGLILSRSRHVEIPDIDRLIAYQP